VADRNILFLDHINIKVNAVTIFALVCQVLIAIVIFNVWVVRRNRTTPYRPEGAGNLEEEFSVYGLPDWVRLGVGGTKLLLASLLLIGLFVIPVARVSSGLLALLMVAAVAAHLRVRDPFIKAVPAIFMAVMCGFVFLIR
jgi:hypothetical protein